QWAPSCQSRVPTVCQIQVPAPPPSLKVCSVWSCPVLSAVSGHLYCPQSLVIPCTVSAVSVHPLYYVRSLWSSPVVCPQSLVISCTVSAASGHLLYYVRRLRSSLVLCPQSLVISCTVCSLWSSPVLCPQCLVTSCTMSAV
ncbi:unnamed protein product, partial [Staurois parvus]